MDVWSASDPTTAFTGPFFAGELSVAPAPGDTKGRAADRINVELGAALRQRGAAGVSVKVMDLSVQGFRVATHLELCKGADVWLRLPGLEPCHAIVMWTKGPMIGCKFSRPLHPAVLDLIVRKSKGR